MNTLLTYEIESYIVNHIDEIFKRFNIVETEDLLPEGNPEFFCYNRLHNLENKFDLHFKRSFYSSFISNLFLGPSKAKLIHISPEQHSIYQGIWTDYEQAKTADRALSLINYLSGNLPHPIPKKVILSTSLIHNDSLFQIYRYQIEHSKETKVWNPYPPEE